MAVTQGFDTAVAPNPDEAIAICNELDASFIAYYIGGPYSGGSGYTREWLLEMHNKRNLQFLATYVGQQLGGNLTHEQGIQDGREAAQLMRNFGYKRNTYVALDMEENTTSGDTQRSLAYQSAWCWQMNQEHFYPGIYASPLFLKLLQPASSSAAFIWLADWVANDKVDGLHPRYAAQNYGLSLKAWPLKRVWQYAGNVTKAGYQVDLDVANFTLSWAPV